MKKIKLKFTILSALFLIIGIVMFLIQRNWIVIYWNFGNVEGETHLQKNDAFNRKKVKIFFWKDEKFKHEDTIIIWSDNNKNENIKHLVNAWLATQLDEKIFSKKIDLENVALSEQEQDVFISFSQCFAWEECSIFRKYKLIDSFLKTIQYAAPEIKYVRILVNNKPLEDTHLSFVQPWPIDGFE